MDLSSEQLARELTVLHDDILDRTDRWVAPLGGRLDAVIRNRLDPVLEELALRDAFSPMEERDRQRVENALREVRDTVAEVGHDLRSGPSRSVGERLRALAVDLDLAPGGP